MIEKFPDIEYAIAGAVTGLALAAVLALLTGCTRRDVPPCDPATVAAITARCMAEASLCPEDPELPCPAEDACHAELDAREATCLAR